jgi:hypothetical protein
MMGHRIVLDGAEMVKLCCAQCRRHIQLGRGESRYIKRKISRRARQQAKTEIRSWRIS